MMLDNSSFRLVSMPEAQRTLGASRSTLYKLISGNEIPAFKVGRRTLIKSTDLEAFIAGLPSYGTPSNPRSRADRGEGYSNG